MLTEASSVVIASAATLGALGYLARWAWRATGVMHDLADSLLGDAASGRQGVIERLTRIEQVQGEHTVALHGVSRRLDTLERAST